MSHPPEELQLVDFDLEQQKLMDNARTATARRAGSTIFHGDGLRQTMVALLQDAELSDHESPPEAFIHVLQGKITVNGNGRSWNIIMGQLLPVPPERHSVTALEDTVLTLTVLRPPAIAHALTDTTARF
ncbi:hypothetical protein GCM10009720_07160 [Yaniella flava]|uniref:LuxR family transcriptional regulator n=1 Tax=Yaniella flava TaxID=287930 RepID=A0ABP5FN23_9MICC